MVAEEGQPARPREPLLNTISSQTRKPVAIPDSIGESVLRQAIDAAREGVSICDARHPELPLVYVNAAFTRMTGYPAEEILGINCRFLQGDDTLQPEIDKLRKAIRLGSGCIVTLRNYGRDGKLFYNELSLSPIRDAQGQLTHFVGIQKNVTRRVVAEQKLDHRSKQLHNLKLELENVARCDPLTGLLNRKTFEECLDQEWRRALRDDDVLNLFMLDVDHFRALNDRYGYAIADACLRKIAGVLEECFGRASDFVARFGGDEFVILNAGLSADEAGRRGRFLLEAIRALSLPAPVERLTLSIGLVAFQPRADIRTDSLRRTAEACLERARRAGGNRLEQATAN